MKLHHLDLHLQPEKNGEKKTFNKIAKFNKRE